VFSPFDVLPPGDARIPKVVRSATGQLRCADREMQLRRDHDRAE
jgi:hypothetical protein